MDSPLTQIQQRLEGHFDNLARSRDSRSFPIFALEHGLNETDRKRICSMLPSSLDKRSLLSRHWLLWVVYATELGYDYEGDEYWSSFEKKTPGWEYQDRAQIKMWFHKFQSTYDGVIPSGRWAKQFTIIAGPITHALLPLYLQRQFAKLLYDLRFQLVSQITPDACTIGRLLASHAFHASGRFKIFLEQEELTGQIALALLGGEPVEGQLICPLTLKRIVADLERVRNARDWLRETQRLVSDRFRGIGRGSGTATPYLLKGSREPDLPDPSGLAIQPRLFLRRAGAGKWSVFLRVKSFRAVAALSSDIHSFLDSTRCRLNGAHDFKPTGWLLSGDREGALRSWPVPAEPLIHFELSDSVKETCKINETRKKMDHLLASECRLHPGPNWLFRIGKDGIAHHIAGLIVRPGIDYVVVTTKPVPDDLEGVTPCSLDCENVRAYRLSMPSPVSAEMTNRLISLELQVARTIRVWPSGLPGRGWDGEGSSEWLTTESPCLGIAGDYPVESLSFRLNDDPEVLIDMEGAEYPLFVRLPPLPAGEHKLLVKAHRSPDLESVVSTPAAEGFARLAVREPEAWKTGVTLHSGLIVRVDPDHANLDTLWRNKIRLSVNGPEGFTATFFVTLQSADGQIILPEEQIGVSMNLPITQDEWRDRFARFLKNKERAWKYLEAAVCILTIRADTLGTRTLRFERDPEPVRWALDYRRQDIVVRLIDDSGEDETDLRISRYSIERPFEREPLTPENARSGNVVEPPGELFVATLGRYCDAVLVSTQPRDLQELSVTPMFPRLSKNISALSADLRLVALWHGARLSDFFATYRQGLVMKGAKRALCASLCGENWAKSERSFDAQSGSYASLRSLAALVDKHTDFGTFLLNQFEADGIRNQISARFSEMAARNNVCQDHELSEFAFRLVSEPWAVIDHPSLQTLLKKLIDNPAILRAARLLALLENCHLEDNRDGTPSNRDSR